MHTRLATANYWSGYGAAGVTCWLTLFDGDGHILAEWEEDCGNNGAAITIDSREVRARFGLGDFTVVFSLAMVLIVVLLYLALQSLLDVMVVCTNVVVIMIGGIWSLLFAGMNHHQQHRMMMLGVNFTPFVLAGPGIV